VTVPKPPALLFGTVGSPISTPKKPGGSPGAILQTRELGLGALELAWVQSVRIREETCALINQTAREQGIALSIHAPYFINLNAADDEWPRSRKRLMDAAHYGNLAGATDIVFHPGSYFGRDRREVLEVALPRLRGCVDELRAAGNPATLRPETMGKSAMLGSLEDTLVMAQEIEGVEPCIDIAHLHARPGDGSVNTYAEFALVLKTVKKALGTRALKNLHFHASGIVFGPKGEKHHVPLKESDFKYREFFQALIDFKARGRVLCESPAMEQDALVMKKTWEERAKRKT